MKKFYDIEGGGVVLDRKQINWFGTVSEAVGWFVRIIIASHTYRTYLTASGLEEEESIKEKCEFIIYSPLHPCDMPASVWNCEPTDRRWRERERERVISNPIKTKTKDIKYGAVADKGRVPTINDSNKVPCDRLCYCKWWPPANEQRHFCCRLSNGHWYRPAAKGVEIRVGERCVCVFENMK